MFKHMGPYLLRLGVVLVRLINLDPSLAYSYSYVLTWEESQIPFIKIILLSSFIYNTYIQNELNCTVAGDKSYKDGFVEDCWRTWCYWRAVIDGWIFMPLFSVSSCDLECKEYTTLVRVSYTPRISIANSKASCGHIYKRTLVTLRRGILTGLSSILWVK